MVTLMLLWLFGELDSDPWLTTAAVVTACAQLAFVAGMMVAILLGVI